MRKQNEIAELKIRTARKGGAILAETVSPGNPQFSREGRIRTLPDGLSFNQSSRWQALASIPEDQFEEEIADRKELRASLGPPRPVWGKGALPGQRRRVEDMEAPTAGDGTESVFLFRLYGPGGEIATFATSVGVWEAGEVLTLPDGRRFEITSIALVAGGDVDGLFEVAQVE